jgi:hypothetical protein
MRTKIVDSAEAKTVSAKIGTKTRPRRSTLLLLFFAVMIAAGGCEGYYSAYPGYGPYYGGYPGYGPGPYYGGYPGSVTVEVGDRPYYTRGAGYYVGRSYYAWAPGSWGWRHHHRYWRHGYYHIR